MLHHPHIHSIDDFLSAACIVPPAAPRATSRQASYQLSTPALLLEARIICIGPCQTRDQGNELTVHPCTPSCDQLCGRPPIPSKLDASPIPSSLMHQISPASWDPPSSSIDQSTRQRLAYAGPASSPFPLLLGCVLILRLRYHISENRELSFRLRRAGRTCSLAASCPPPQPVAAAALSVARPSSYPPPPRPFFCP
jgi:hypothetical protein